MSGNRAILIPEVPFDEDHITQAPQERTDGLTTQPAVPDSGNLGSLAPSPFGTPDGQVATDVWMRTAGNVGAARWGYKDQGDADYKGKMATHVPHEPTWLEYETAFAIPRRPKALPMQSGELLLIWVKGTAGSVVFYKTFNPSTGWSATSSFSTGFPAGSAQIMADVVQMPDGELILTVLGTDSNNETLLQKFSSRDDTGATIAWHAGPTQLNKVGGGASLMFKATGFAMEVLPSGRIAMLIHRYGIVANIVRTYSDDRGVTWNDLEIASSTPYIELVGAGTIDFFGGVSIERTCTGSLVALVGVAEGDNTVTGMNNVKDPALIAMVSDDGDNWSGLQKITENDTGIAIDKVFDFPFSFGGAIEGAVVAGDDGLIRFIGAYHGDTNVGKGFYDDLAILTTRRGDISAKDAAPVVPEGTSISLGEGVTCSDIFEAEVAASTGFRSPGKTGLVLNRIAATEGTAGGDLDAATDYHGPRDVEAVNYRGAIWVFMACEDTTAGTDYALGYMRLNPWSELFEKPADVTDSATILLGNVYSQGWSAYSTPTDSGLTVVGGGAQALDDTAAYRGLRINPAAAISSAEIGTIAGIAGQDAHVRFVVRPVSGGSLTADDIAVRIALSDGVNFNDLSIRFDVGTSTMRVFDNQAAAQLGSDELIDFTTGVEVVVSYNALTVINGIFFRALTVDPEDGFVDVVTGTTNVLISTAAGTTEFVRFGTLTATSPDSAWRGVWVTREDVAGAGGDSFLFTGSNAWDAATPVFPEFALDEPGFDDGLRHGTRAPLTKAQAQYMRDGLLLAWRGSDGREGDSWTVNDNNQFAAENAHRQPVCHRWESEDDGTLLNFTWDAGDDGKFNPDAVALFGLNAKTFRFQMDPVGGFTTTPVDILVDTSGGDKFRHQLEFSSFAIEGADSRVIRITGAASQPLEPHRFRSNERQSWYVWLSTPGKSVRIIDNDGYCLTLAASASGASGTVYVFPDKIAFDVAGGALGSGGGYRFMRLQFSAQDLYETRFRLGYAVIGQKVLLTGGFHPQWGWDKTVRTPRAVTRLETGPWIRDIKDAPLETWSYGWSGLRDRGQQTALDEFPQIRENHAKMADVISRTKGGAVPIALLPVYEDGRATSALRSFDVIPARITGEFNGAQINYECHSNNIEGNTRSILDVSAINIEEIG